MPMDANEWITHVVLSQRRNAAKDKTKQNTKYQKKKMK